MRGTEGGVRGVGVEGGVGERNKSNVLFYSLVFSSMSITMNRNPWT